MTKYDKSIIYKLCCKDTSITDIYVGSTTAFKNRKYQHKQCCNDEKGKKYNLNVYQFIRDNGNFENWDMVEIERYNAFDKLDLHKRERYWIEELKSSLNSIIPTQTRKEHYEKNKDKTKQKEYRELNKDTIKTTNIKYRENNKDKIKTTNIKYRENNKDKINEKFECVCGGKYKYKHKSTHLKTKKHLDFLEKQKQH